MGHTNVNKLEVQGPMTYGHGLKLLLVSKFMFRALDANVHQKSEQKIMKLFIDDKRSSYR